MKRNYTNIAMLVLLIFGVCMFSLWVAGEFDDTPTPSATYPRFSEPAEVASHPPRATEPLQEPTLAVDPTVNPTEYEEPGGAWENAGDPTTPYFWMTNDDGSMTMSRFMYHNACYEVYSNYLHQFPTDRYNDLLRAYNSLDGLWYASGTVDYIEYYGNYSILLLKSAEGIYVVEIADDVHLIVGDPITVWGELTQGEYMVNGSNGQRTRAPKIIAYDFIMDNTVGVPVDVLKESAKYKTLNDSARSLPDLPDYAENYWLYGAYSDLAGNVYLFDGYNSVNGYPYTVHFWYYSLSRGVLCLMVHFIDMPEDCPYFTYIVFQNNTVKAYTSTDSGHDYRVFPVSHIELSQRMELGQP